MNPDEIARKAKEERLKNEEASKRPPKEPFNPLDWMDFKRTRKWMGRNLALSDKFYGYLMLLLMLMFLTFWFWLDSHDESKWQIQSFIGVSSLFVVSCIFGFIYGYRKAHKKIK